MKAVEQGILIHRAPYSETSLLVTVLTKTQGMVTYLFQGGKKKHGNVLYPMAHIEFTYYKRTDSSLGKISQLNLATVSKTIPFDPVKSGIAFFIAELVQQTIRSGHAENQLFQVLLNEITWLDASDELTNYPLWFLGVFSGESGTVPAIEAQRPTVLDLLGGKLTTVRPLHVQYLEGDWIHWFEDILQGDKLRFLSMNIPKQERLLCFDAWLQYFKTHMHGIRTLKSVEVIREVMG
jgi:DNA repair protein RecO (recombination protein O)